MVNHEKLNLFDKIIAVFSKPNDFFAYVKNEIGIGSAFVYFAVLSLFSTFVDYILNILFGESPIFVLVISYGLGLALIFVASFVFHIFLKIFDGKSNYEGTFKAYAYSITPSLLFGWIPYIKMVALLYSIYLGVKGFSIIHEISMVKSFFAFIMPIILLIIMLIVAYIIGISYLTSINPYLSNDLTETTGMATRIFK
ncbi:MAG: Yip1 family protein [Candidatus Aenigmatarchaeota archaeon]|nr:YIP1 family protein [Candidatus Aenigmarchaeota archaeon]